MDENENDLIIPIVREEVHVDAVPYVTGGVRVTKRVESHDEIIEQELRKSHVEVKRVKLDRIVDGPQPTRRVENTLIIPVVSEVLHVEKRWILTEEIHITELLETETARTKVTVNSELAEVERLDAEGNPLPVVNPARHVDSIVEPARRTETNERLKLSHEPASILKRR